MGIAAVVMAVVIAIANFDMPRRILRNSGHSRREKFDEKCNLQSKSRTRSSARAAQAQERFAKRRRARVHVVGRGIGAALHAQGRVYKRFRV